MHVTAINADFAQVIDGRLTMVGGWWDLTSPAPVPRALALVFTLDWGELDQTHTWHLTLRDADGNAVGLGPEAAEIVDLRGEIQVPREEMMQPGRPVNTIIAINFAPVPLPPGEQLVWHVSVDGAERAEWRRPFTVGA